MKCFHNTAEDAVGTCKSCGRGLSVAHAVEFPKGLACKNHCEKDVENLNALIDNNVAMRGASATLVRGSASTFYASFVLYIVMAGGFIWMGTRLESPGPIFYIGLGFGGFAIYTLIRALKVSKEN